MDIITMKGVFTPDECDGLISSYGPGASVWRPSTRKMIYTKEIGDQWYIDRVGQCIERANKHFKFELDGLTDNPSLVRYDEGCYFNWHHDMNSGRDGVYRKFSLITILSKPGSHDGGTLQFFDHGVVDTHMPNQGTVFAFPSWVQHRVTKVTRGTRHSAVAFVGGPKFR